MRENPFSVPRYVVDVQKELLTELAKEVTPIHTPDWERALCNQEFEIQRQINQKMERDEK